MATRKKKGGVAEIPRKQSGISTENGDGNAAEDSGDVTESDRVISEILSDLGSQGECLIYRRHRATGPKEAYIDSVPAEQITPEWIKDTYGGGTYRLQFKGPDETGRRVYRRQVRLTITEELPPKMPSYGVGSGGDGEEPLGVARSPQGGGLSNAMDATVIGFIRSMNEMQVMQMESLKAIVQRKDGDVPSVLDKLVPFVPLLAPLVAALTQSMLRRDEGSEKVMEMAREIAGMIGKNQAPASSIKEMAETLSVLRDLSGDFGGERSDPAGAMLAQIAPAIVDAIARSNPAAPDGATPAGAVPRPAAVASGQPAAQTGDRMGMLKIALTPYAKAVISMAKRGKDAELQGMAMADNVPEAMLGAARQFVAEEDSFSKLLAMFPEFLAHQEWVEQWYGAFHDALLGIEDVEEEPPQTGADAPAPEGGS